MYLQKRFVELLRKPKLKTIKKGVKQCFSPFLIYLQELKIVNFFELCCLNSFRNYASISTVVVAAICLYVPFTNFSRIASKAAKVSSISAKV